MYTIPKPGQPEHSRNLKAKRREKHRKILLDHRLPDGTVTCSCGKDGLEYDEFVEHLLDLFEKPTAG